MIKAKPFERRAGQGDLKKRGEKAEFLTRHGGWVLLLFGAVLIGLAVVVASHEALAAIFAFTGIASAVIGVLLPRLTGDFEFSPTRLAATLKEIRNTSVREDLTFEERANEVLRLLEVGGSFPTQSAQHGGDASSLDQSRAGDDTLPSVPTFEVEGPKRRGSLGVEFERHVMDAFRQADWKLTLLERGHDVGVDFVAKRKGRTIYVQLKFARRLSVADLDRVAATFSRVDPSGVAGHVLAINEGALSLAARERLMQTPSLEVVEIPVEGW
jgi:hypothetical protein